MFTMFLVWDLSRALIFYSKTCTSFLLVLLLHIIIISSHAKLTLTYMLCWIHKSYVLGCLVTNVISRKMASQVRPMACRSYHVAVLVHMVCPLLVRLPLIILYVLSCLQLQLISYVSKRCNDKKNVRNQGVMLNLFSLFKGKGIEVFNLKFDGLTSMMWKRKRKLKQMDKL